MTDLVLPLARSLSGNSSSSGISRHVCAFHSPWKLPDHVPLWVGWMGFVDGPTTVCWASAAASFCRCRRLLSSTMKMMAATTRMKNPMSVQTTIAASVESGIPGAFSTAATGGISGKPTFDHLKSSTTLLLSLLSLSASSSSSSASASLSYNCVYTCLHCVPKKRATLL